MILIGCGAAWVVGAFLYQLADPKGSGNVRLFLSSLPGLAMIAIGGMRLFFG